MRLKQVLISILTNSVKHTKEGKIEMAVSYDDTSQKLHCTISDNGDGFNEEKQRQLTQLLSTKNKAQELELSKTNVSLYICKKLVEITGGTLSAHSDGENLGATFKFDMKMRLGNEQDADLSSSSSQGSHSGENIEDLSFSETHRSDYMSVFQQVNRDESASFEIDRRSQLSKVVSGSQVFQPKLIGKRDDAADRRKGAVSQHIDTQSDLSLVFDEVMHVPGKRTANKSKASRSRKADREHAIGA